MKKPLLEAIHGVWALPSTAIPAGLEAHVVEHMTRAWEDEARRLDGILTARIAPWIDQWQEGLIAAHELAAKIAWEGTRTDWE